MCDAFLLYLHHNAFLGEPLFADSAYVGQEETLEKYRMTDEICEQGYREHPMTEE